MTEFWLIAVPAEKKSQHVWEKLQTATSKTNLSTNSKFEIPELKIGTLDILVGVSDDLDKLDSFLEVMVNEMARYTADIMEENEEKVGEKLLVDGVDIASYVRKFQWNMAKYPITESLKNLTDMISKGAKQINSDFKDRSTTYNEVKISLKALEKKNTGSLLTKNLTSVVKKEDFVLDSEYLTTILVVVPKACHSDWLKQYETLTEMVVPRSSRVISEDVDYCLCNVTLFRKSVNEFTLKARDMKYLVREFQYDEEKIKADKDAINIVSTDKKHQFGLLIWWLKVNFSEAFGAWIHVKALRIFVESVLRYGLPANFQAMLLQPNKKTVKRLREVLYNLYKHLDSTATTYIDLPVDLPDLKFSEQETYPYVCCKINCQLL